MKKLHNREQHLFCWRFAETSWLDLPGQPQKQMISTARSFTNQPGHSLTWPLKMLCCNSLGSSEGLGHELPLLLAWPYNKPFSAPNSDISASVTSLCVRHMDSHLVTKSQIRHWLMNLRIYDFVFLKISFLQTKIVCKISVQFSSSVMFDSLQPHGLQNARPPCSSPTPGAYSNPSPLSQRCHPTISSSVALLLLPSIFPSIRVFSDESARHIRWPKYWSFSISPSNEYSGWVSFRID